MRALRWTLLALALLASPALAQTIGPGGGGQIGGGGGGGGGGCTANCTFTGTTTTSGIVDAGGISTSNGLTLNGVGPGVSLGGGVQGAVVNNQVSYNYPTSTFIRNRFWFDTVQADVNSSQIDEGFFVGRQFNGSATLTGEINGIHSFLADTVGPTFHNSMEGFEYSTNYAAQHDSISGYIALPTFTSTGSLTASTGSSYGFVYSLTNANTAVGSIPISVGFNCKVMQGGGSQPTNSLCLQNVDPLQGIATAGNVTIGSAGMATGERLHITGPDATSGILLRMVNSASTIILTAQDNGNITGNANYSITGTGQFSQAFTAPEVINSNGTATTAAIGAGAGSGSSVTVSGMAHGHVVTLITGISPTANSVLATPAIQPSGCPTQVYPTVTPGNAATAAAMLTAPVWAVGSGVGKNYTINSGNVALTASTTYVFNVHVDCS